MSLKLKSVTMLLVLAAALFHQGDCFSMGDVRLNYYGSSSYRGILQVYMQGQWGTVCAKKFNFAAAAAVCRQMGYLNAAEEPQSIEELEMEGVEGDGPMWLENVQCPDLAIGCTNAKYYEQCNAIYAEYGERHILRCSWNMGEEARRQAEDKDEEDEPCDRDDQVFITCETTRAPPNYSGSVQLMSTGPNDTDSGGLVMIYDNEKWYPICWSSFHKPAADSACQQLGYTNAIAYHIVYNDSISEMLKVDFSCQSSSQPCFSNCINHDNTRMSTNLTDEECWYSGKNGGQFALALMINCTFEPGLAQIRPAGTKFMCEKIATDDTNDDQDDDFDDADVDDNDDTDEPDAEAQDDTEAPVPQETGVNMVLVAGVTIGALAVLVTIIIMTVVTGVCCINPTCPMYKWRLDNYQNVA